MSVENNILLLCEHIKLLRAKINLSKKEMAQKLGTSIKSITKIESGILPRSINAITLYKIHKIFNISIENLLETRLP
jgi:transcriptional regulator with XRE-family HTH domain